MKKVFHLYLLFLIVLSLLVCSLYFIVRNNEKVISQSPILTVENNANDSDNTFYSDNITLLTNTEVNTIRKESQENDLNDITPIDTKVDITLNFMGDCTLGTYCGEFTENRFNETAERVSPGYFFEGVKDILDKGTFNITNCEGVFTDNDLEEVYKDYSPAFWFKSPAKNAGIFSHNGIDVVGIANNHIGDYGSEGRLDTIKALVENNVQWSDSTRPVILEYNGIKIVLFCIATWDDGMPEYLCTQIQEYSYETDLQIVFFHGGTENIHTPDDHKVEYAHQFIDAGADLIVGSHPHVLQPIEEYNGVKIVYSLGNFVYGGHTAPENRTIVYTYTFHFDKKKLLSKEEEIHPCYIYTGEMNAFQPVPIDDEQDKQMVLDFMHGKIDSPL